MSRFIRNLIGQTDLAQVDSPHLVNTQPVGRCLNREVAYGQAKVMLRTTVGITIPLQLFRDRRENKKRGIFGPHLIGLHQTVNRVPEVDRVALHHNESPRLFVEATGCPSSRLKDRLDHRKIDRSGVENDGTPSVFKAVKNGLRYRSRLMVHH